MKSFYEKEDYTIEDIQALITDQVEESIYLDFKEAGALNKVEKKRTDISKDVASFANSAGGIIVYGLKEENHIASELSFLDGNEFTKEWLEQVIRSSIQRNITDVMIYPVRQDGDMRKTVYVVKIPESANAPHLSRDNRFYKRYNFMSVPMEEYEVRQTYGRKQNTKLSIARWYLSNKWQEEDEQWKKVHFAVQAKNDSMTMESNYKVNIFIYNVNDYLTYEWQKTDHNFNITSIDKSTAKITAVCKDPIFAGEVVNVIHLKILLDKVNLTKALEGVSVTIQLLYSNGEDIQTFTLLEEYNKLASIDTPLEST
jgi:hypothetical protein